MNKTEEGGDGGRRRWKEVSWESPTKSVENSRSPTWNTKEPGCVGAKARIEPSMIFTFTRVHSLGMTDSKVCGCMH